MAMQNQTACRSICISPALTPSLEVLNITHHSVELAWRTVSHDQSHDPEAGRLLYTVQEEEVGKGRGFSTIYR